MTITLIIVLSIASTGLSFSPSVYVDGASGVQVNRNTPEYTIVSYYELLNKRGYDGAYQLFTPAFQKLVSPQDMENQLKNLTVKSSRMTRIFPAKQVNNYAAVGYLRNLIPLGPNEEQVVLAVNFLTRDSFGSRWSIMGSPSEIPDNVLVSFYNELLDLDKEIETGVLGLTGYTEKQKAQIAKQVKAQVSAHQNQLEQVKDYLTNGVKLKPVNPAVEFIKEVTSQESSPQNIPNHP